MARRKKPKRGDEREDQPPPPAGEARTSLRGLLKDVVLRPPEATPKPSIKPAPPKATPKKREAPPPKESPPAKAPSSVLRGEDRIVFHEAFAGVRPLADKRPRRTAPPAPAPARARSAGDVEARDRLGALVAGGVRFEIAVDGDEIRGLRAGSPPSVLSALLRRDAVPMATLDLHGMRGDDAEREVVRFVRREQRRGARRVAIVHGKGLHSEGGVGVLRDRAVHALTEGGAAPVVIAFATAHASQGGSGALLVELAP